MTKKHTKKEKKACTKASKKQVFLTAALLFAIGSFLGWIFEFFVRGISEKHFYNPGFLHGPYLPIYGFGIVGLYAVGKLRLPIENKWLAVVVKVVIATVALTTIEYVGGWIFIKKLGLRLWDYSDKKGNVQGLICPLCSLVWAGFSAVYLLFFQPQVDKIETKTDKRAVIPASLVIFYSVLAMDLLFTLLG